MSSRSSSQQKAPGLASLIPLHSTTDVPLQWQIYQGLRQAIVARQLSGGVRLPSSRALASALAISRSPVFQAYRQLLLEGYLEGHRGSGTFVAHTLPDASLAPPRASKTVKDDQPRLATMLPVSPVSPVPTLPILYGNPKLLAFRLGMPALDAFPYALWQRLLAQNYRRSWQHLFDYQEARGYQPLREAIASYLAVARGVRCTAEQVIITSGTQDGLNIIVRTLLSPGDAVWMEDPGYHEAQVAFQQAGLRLAPVPVGQDGFEVALARALASEARLAYVTPSHQFPLGATMSMERRLALLEWARTQRGWIIEDDYDSEYRYVGPPLPALQGLDDAGRVLYLGSFSKMLFPALRLGYLVVPPALVETFSAARLMTDLHASSLVQAMVADFLTEGHFQRHVRRMRTLYAQRQALLHELLDQHLSNVLTVQPDPAGMHLVAWLPPGLDSQKIVRAARAHDLAVAPLSYCSLRPLQRDALLLGYAAPNESQIREGIRKLTDILEGNAR